MSDLISTMLEDLATCLCERLAQAGTPDLCYCGVMPGGVAPDIYLGGGGDCEDKNGQAWVRLAGSYSTQSFPAQYTQATACNGLDLAINIEVGVRRLMGVGGSAGQMPEPAEQAEATLYQLSDMVQMQQAITCCFAERYDVVLGAYTPSGPQGGAVGGTWTLTALVS